MAASKRSLPERDHQQVMVDVTTVVDLAHAFVPSLLARGEGAIINTASTASFQPLPYMAVYGASKAFVLSFSQALSEEYRDRNLRVLALCPGATETAFLTPPESRPQLVAGARQSRSSPRACGHWNRGAASL